MAVKNSTILEKAWLSGGNDYQQRVPDVTQSNISRVVNTLFNYQPAYNQFMSFLITRVGDTIIHNNQWDNRLKPFKKGMMFYGNTIQELAPSWITAHTYNANTEQLLKKYAPEGGAWYHEQNRQDFYPITISRDAVRNAFIDEYGLNRLLDSCLQVAYNSDNYDEYRIMLNLIAEYESNWGFYHKGMAIPSDKVTGDAFLADVRAMSERLYFPSTNYNATDIPIPVFAKPEEMLLLTTPEVKACIDVYSLAAAFHIDKANIEQRIIVVDEFPIENMYALLTTDDFFVPLDTEYTTTEFFDPRALATTYYLHHWGVYSVSPYVPAIAYFNDNSTTEINTITITPTSLTVNSVNTNNIREDLRGIACARVILNATVNPGNTRITTKPNAVTIDIDSISSGDDDIPTDAVYYRIFDTTELDDLLITNTETRDAVYVVFYQNLDAKNGTETIEPIDAGSTIAAKFDSTYINPSGTITPLATVSANITTY